MMQQTLHQLERRKASRERWRAAHPYEWRDRRQSGSRSVAGSSQVRQPELRGKIEEPTPFLAGLPGTSTVRQPVIDGLPDKDGQVAALAAQVAALRTELASTRAELAARVAELESELNEYRGWKERERERSRRNHQKRVAAEQQRLGNSKVSGSTAGSHRPLPAVTGEPPLDPPVPSSSPTGRTPFAVAATGGEGGPATAAARVLPDEIWQHAEVLNVSRRRGLELSSERTKFEDYRTEHGERYTLRRVIRWLETARPPAPIDFAVMPPGRTDQTDRRSRSPEANGVAKRAYQHDSWEARGIKPPVDDRVLARGNVL